MVREVQERLRDQHIQLDIRKDARDWLIDKGFDEKYGARPLRRILQKEVEDSLSMEILKGRFSPGSSVVVTVKDNKVIFRSKRQKKGAGKVKELIVR
jgi:ATP-dependent Clp protease ATP-binding subunit ClpC